MNYSELLQLAKGWGNFISDRIIIWRLPNLIGKYASDLDIENLPDITVDNHVEEKNKATKDWQDVSC